MNVTVVPGQKGLLEAAMVTPAGRVVLATMVTGVEVAGLFEMHVTRDETRRHEIHGKVVHCIAFYVLNFIFGSL